jgi:hypothetical protein
MDNHEAALKRAAEQGFDISKVYYHATNARFNHFDITKSADTCIWMTDDIDTLLNGEQAATGTEYILAVYIQSDKLVGWDDYEKYTLDELIAQDKDGALLGDTVMLLHPTKMRSTDDDFLVDNIDKSIIINPRLNIDPFKEFTSFYPEPSYRSMAP